MEPPMGRASREDGFGQERRDDPVRRIDDLADLEIDGHAAEDVRLLAAEPALRRQMLDHVADRLLSAGEEVGPGRRRHEARPAIGRRQERPAGPELRLLQLPPFREAEAERDPSHHLDRGDAHLAVALRRMGVADAEQGAVHPHRQEERGAGDQVLHVHVAAVLPWRHRAVRSGLVERDAHHAGKRRERHRDVATHARVRAVAEIPDREVRLRELGLRHEAAARTDRGPAERGGGLHVEDLDREHVTALGAPDAHRPCQRVTAERAAAEDVGVRGRRRVVAVGRVARVEDHRVARIDREARRQRVVPLPVNRVAIEMMGGRHRVRALPSLRHLVPDHHARARAPGDGRSFRACRSSTWCFMRATVYRVSRRVLDFWRVCHEATRDMDIEPFHGYRYAGATRTDVSPIVAPPYDQISPETQERLHAMSPHNIVRATYPRDGGEKYRQAASVLEAWLAQGVWRRDERPAIYPYQQTYSVGGQSVTRTGFIALGEVSDYARGVVLPHERTHAGPKEDRMRLLEATAADIGLLFMLMSDADGELGHAAAPVGELIAEAEDLRGEHHRLWRITDDAALAPIVTLMAPRPVIIADGHHRYETAVAYRQRHPHAARKMMAFFALEAPGLTILANHRLVHGVQPFDFDDFVQMASRWFAVAPLDDPLTFRPAPASIGVVSEIGRAHV